MNMNVAMFFNVILFFIGANKLKDIFTGGKLPTKRNERTNEMQIISGPSVARAVDWWIYWLQLTGPTSREGNVDIYLQVFKF